MLRSAVCAIEVNYCWSIVWNGFSPTYSDDDLSLRLKASHGLAQQASQLMQLMAQFKTDEGGYKASVRVVPVTAAAQPQPSPARALGRKIANAFKGNTAVAAEWSEF